MRRHTPIALLALTSLTPIAQASAPDAWNAHYREVVDRCLAASQLHRARTDGHLMLFSDAVGTALLVRGTVKGKKAEARKLCIVRRGAPAAIEIQPVDDGVDPRTLPR